MGRRWRKVTATSEIVGPSVDVIKANITAGIDTEIAYTDGKVEINGVKDLEYEGGITLKLVGLDKDGEPVADMSTGVADITKFVIEATFDPAEVAAVPHTATVKFKMQLRLRDWIMMFCMKRHLRLL